MSQEPQVVTGGDKLRLEAFGFKVFSQGDDDGIISEIFRRIGAPHRTFVEFGAEAGLENNTRYLLSQGWRGLWIEASPRHSRKLRRKFRKQITCCQLAFIEAAVTAENIDDLLRSRDITGEIDFLSIDIDGNDYHVFEAINAVTPRVVCLEYQSGRPPPEDWAMPYDPAYRWDTLSDDYGASLVALDRLARRKGYVLVGTALYSSNAFFVRYDLIGDHFSAPFEPTRFFRQVSYEQIIDYSVFGARCRQ